MQKFIPDVKPGAYKWTVRVLVLDKSKPIDGKNGKNGYQRLLLADQKGNKIQGMIFGPDIHHWRNHLTSHQYYDISNAIVTPVSLEYQKNGFMTQWILNNKTIIENSDEDNSAFDEQALFTPFSTFAASIDSPISCDVVGVVAVIRPPRSVQLKNGANRVQEIIMIDEELLPVILSVWGTFVEKEAVTIADTYKTSYPVIMVTRVKVVSYKGFSLATRAGSGIIVDSPLSRVATLKAWALENSIALKDAVAKINVSDL